jgi:hypothetical protein
VDRPRVSAVFFLYFYYKTGCQGLFVKKYDEYLGDSDIAAPPTIAQGGDEAKAVTY